MKTHVPDLVGTLDDQILLRDRLTAEAREIMARARTEQRGLSPDEELDHDEVLSAISRCTRHIARLEERAQPLIIHDRTGTAHNVTAAYERSRDANARGLEARTLGKQIVSAPGFAGFRAASAGAHVGFDLTLETRATSVTGSVCGGVLTPPPPPDLSGSVPPAALATMLRVSDLLKHRADGNAPCSFPEYGARTGSTAYVAPGTAKPDVGLTVVYKQAVFQKIAGIAVVNDEVFEDDPGAIMALDSELYIDLLNEIDKAILTETGGAGHFTGLMPASTGPDTAATGLTPTGAILTAMGALQTASGVLPDGLVMSFATAAAIATTLASTSGVYLTEPSIGALPAWAAGLRLALSPDVPNGTALIGSFSRGAELVSKRAIRIDRSSTGDLFSTNQTMLRVEQRLSLCIFRPLSFGMITALPGGA